jgi:hypothetical protein
MSTKSMQLDLSIAKQLYAIAGGDIKKKLEDHFGQEELTKTDITDRVKSFEDACKELGVRPSDIVLPSDDVDESAYKKLKVIILALNEKWRPDWTNDNEYKYYIWFDLSSGSGLSFDYVDVQYSYSFVGSRLCFKSRELAEYAAKTFLDIYTDFFIIK